jgi:hypothetical protein
MSDPANVDAAWNEVEAAATDPDPDYTWVDDLPEMPPAGHTIAIVVPTKPPAKIVE